MQATCDNCGKPYNTTPSEYARKKRHFCSRECYSAYRAEHLPIDEQHAWKGGVTATESNRKWRAKNKKKVEAANRARKLRELNAPGSHTKAEWEAVKAQGCAEADESCSGSMTKDHIVPLIMGGSDDINNIQGLCRSHNSRKSRKVYLGHWSA